MSPRLLLLLLLVPALLGAERSCTRIDDSDADDPSNPNNPAQPFADSFNGGLLNWRLTAPIPNHQLGSGNPLPSMEVGSLSTLVTGGVTVRRFDISGGLVIEADIFWQPPSASTTAAPEAWVGLADADDPTGTPAVAAGMLIDSAGAVHYQVNGIDIGQGPGPGGGAWHTYTTTIRTDRVVEFRIDGALVLTGGVVDAAHAVRPVEACGVGYPERPRIDNVVARLP
jgi:hypothetical protein